MFSRRQFLRTGSLLGIGAVLVTACGAPAASPTAAPAAPAAKPAEPTKAPEAAKPTEAPKPTAAPAAKPAASGAAQQFTFFHYEWEGHGVGLANRWIKPADAFEKETGIKVIRKAVPSTEYWTKMITELSSGTNTEVYYTRPNAVDQYLAMDAIAPLDAYADTKMFNEKFFPAQKERFVRDGKTYGFLCGVTSSALFYNKTLFDAAGLKPPKTYDEMLDSAKKLTKAPNQYGLGVSTQDQPQVLEAVDRYLYGYDTLWGKDKEVMANSPKTVEAISKLKGVVDAGVTPLNQNNPVNRPMYWEGKLAMWMDGPWMPGMTEKPIPHLATALVPLPSGKSSGGAQVLSFSKNGTNKEAAGKYLNFIAKPEWQKVMTVESGNMSGLMGVDYSDFVKAKPWFQTFIDAMPNIQINSAPGWDLFNERWTKIAQSKIAEMYAKNRPVKTVLDEVQTEFEKLVKENLK